MSNFVINPYLDIGEPLSPTFSSYSATNDTADNYSPAFTASRIAVGVQVISGGDLDDYTAGSLKFKFSKSGTLTGNVYARIYTPPVGAGLGTLQATSDAVDITTIANGASTLNFPLVSNYTLQPDDMICIEYTKTGSGSFGIGRDEDNTSNSSDFDNSQMPGTWEVSGDYYSTYLVVNV